MQSQSVQTMDQYKLFNRPHQRIAEGRFASKTTTTQLRHVRSEPSRQIKCPTGVANRTSEVLIESREFGVALIAAKY